MSLNRPRLFVQNNNSVSSATTVSSGSLSSEEEHFVNSEKARRGLDATQQRRSSVVNVQESMLKSSACVDESENYLEELKQLHFDKKRLCQENQRLQRELESLENMLSMREMEIESKTQELNLKSTKLSLMQLENDHLFATQERESLTVRTAQKSAIELEHQIREQEDELNTLRNLIGLTERQVEIFRQELHRESDSLELVSQERDGLQVQVKELAFELRERNESFEKFRNLINIYDEELTERQNFAFALHELSPLQGPNVDNDATFTSHMSLSKPRIGRESHSLQSELMVAQVNSCGNLPSPFCGRQDDVRADPIFTFDSSSNLEKCSKKESSSRSSSCTCSSRSSSCTSFSSTSSSTESERSSGSAAESFINVANISSMQNSAELALYQQLDVVRHLLPSQVAPETSAALNTLELRLDDTLSRHRVETQQLHHVMTECARLQQRNQELVHHLRETSFALETNIQNKITECQVKLKIEVDAMHRVELELAEARCQLLDQEQTISHLRALSTQQMTSQSVQSATILTSIATQTNQIGSFCPSCTYQTPQINAELRDETQQLQLDANFDKSEDAEFENNRSKAENCQVIPNIHIEGEHPLISSQLLVALDLAVTQVATDIVKPNENTLRTEEAPSRIVRHLSVPRVSIPSFFPATDQRSASICGSQRSPLLVKRTLYKLYKSSELQTELFANKRRAESFSAPSGQGAFHFTIPRKHSNIHSENFSPPTAALNSSRLSFNFLQSVSKSSDMKNFNAPPPSPQPPPKFTKQSRINCYKDYNSSSTEFPNQLKHLLPAEHLAVADLGPEAEAELSEEDRLLNIELLRQAAKASVAATRPRALSALNYSSVKNASIKKKTSSLSAISDILYSHSSSTEENEFNETWSEEKGSEEYIDLPVFANDDYGRTKTRSTEQSTDDIAKRSPSDKRYHHSRRPPPPLSIVSEASVDFEDRRLSTRMSDQKQNSEENLNNEVFPSLPDKVLQAMNLLTKTEDEDGDCETECCEDKLEEQFVRLSLAFRTDKQTLNERIALHLRARNQAENNAITELRKTKEYMRALSRNGLLINVIFNNNNNTNNNNHNVNNHIDLENEIGVNSPTELLSRTQSGLEVLEACMQRLAADCEILGAVQQEGRLSKAVNVMMQFVEVLRQKNSNEENELEDTRTMLAASGNNQNLTSMGVSSIDFGLDNMSKRSMSMAGGAGAKSVHISSLGYAIRRPQSLSSDIQNRRSNAALLSSRLAGSAPASVPPSQGFRVLRRSSAALCNDNTINGEAGQSRLRNLVNVKSLKHDSDKRYAEKVHEKTKIDNDSFNKAVDQLPTPLAAGNTSANDSPEIVFQHGFEQGTRIRIGRELSDLRENQVQLVERLESLQDRYQFSEEEEAQMDFATSDKENWLEEIVCWLTDISQWDQRGVHLRWFFCLAALFVAFGMLIWAVLQPRYANLL